MYADDFVLLSPSAMGLSLLLSVCSAYGIEHDIKYNSAKSNVMIFCCNKMKDIHIPNFLLNNVLLTSVTKYKYLGHCISDDLSDDDDMARQYRQIYAQGSALLRRFFYTVGKNKHVTEGHLTLFINTFPDFSQSISNNNDFLLQALPYDTYKLRN